MKTHRKERNLRMLKLFKAGLTYEEIGKSYGVTRQRAWQIIQQLRKQKLSTPSS